MVEDVSKCQRMVFLTLLVPCLLTQGLQSVPGSFFFFKNKHGRIFMFYLEFGFCWRKKIGRERILPSSKTIDCIHPIFKLKTFCVFLTCFNETIQTKLLKCFIYTAPYLDDILFSETESQKRERIKVNKKKKDATYGIET